MHDSPATRPPDRRRFLMLMGLACASGAIARPAAALAQAPPPPAPAPAAAAPAAGATPPSAEALALTEVVRVRFGGALNATQLAAITEDLDGRLDSGRELAKLRHANGVEPDTIFHA